MVVDDDADTRFILRLILEKAGHAVVYAGDGKAALAPFVLHLPDLPPTALPLPLLRGSRIPPRSSATIRLSSMMSAE